MSELVTPFKAAIAAPLRESPALVQWMRRYGLAIVAYVAATLTTTANWTGDTVDYVESIVLASRGIDHWMWDFAHLLWRPLGWILWIAAAPVAKLFVGDNERLQVTMTLNAVNWIAGLVCVICIHSFARRISGRAWIANVVSFGFIFTAVFLNWAQTGSAYVPALALLLAGFEIMLSEKPRSSLLAGAALAGAVCLWVPEVLAVPAAILAPVFLFGFNRQRIRLALKTAIFCALFVGVAYIAVMGILRIHTIDGLRAWIAASAHGVDYGGGKRVILGFARSFISVGNGGLLFKRYLLADPYNPVSLRDLFGITLWKLALFYVFAAAVAITLVQSREHRRVLILFLVNSIPVLALAYAFAGSEPERYLPLFPMLFMAIGVCLATRSRFFQSIAFVFLGFMVINNMSVMFTPVQTRVQAAVVSRVRDLLPRLDDRTLVFTANYQDDLMLFNRTYVFHPVNRSAHLHLSTLVSPGTSWNVHWCEDFASRVLSTWRSGGATWISKRALSARPRPEWNWVEGSDSRVSWKDFPLLMSHLDVGVSVGGDDGFVELLPTPHNALFLSRLTTKNLVAERNHP